VAPDPLALTGFTVERATAQTEDIPVGGSYTVLQQAQVTVDGVRRVDLDPTPHLLFVITVEQCDVAIAADVPVKAAGTFLSNQFWLSDATIDPTLIQTYSFTEICGLPVSQANDFQFVSDVVPDPLVLNGFTVERAAAQTEDIPVGGSYTVLQQAQITVEGVRRVDLDPTPHLLFAITVEQCDVAFALDIPEKEAGTFLTTDNWPENVSIQVD